MLYDGKTNAAPLDESVSEGQSNIQRSFAAAERQSEAENYGAIETVAKNTSLRLIILFSADFWQMEVTRHIPTSLYQLHIRESIKEYI